MSDDETTLNFLTEDFPEFTQNEPYELWLEVSGGTEPITFEIESGEFPTGIGLSSEGYVSGVPMNVGEDTTVFITVSDATGAKLTQAFDCEVRTSEDDEESD